jgi:hypothetical protein
MKILQYVRKRKVVGPTKMVIFDSKMVKIWHKSMDCIFIRHAMTVSKGLII